MDMKFEPTKAQLVAALLKGNSTSWGKAVLVPLSTRVPSWQVAQLDAMATKAGKSRNAMVALVLDAGIEAIRASLDEETLRELVPLEGEASCQLPEGESGETF